MSTKNIIFFDIDGTLLDHDKLLPATAKEAIFSLKEQGHEVVIATGRAPFMFEDLRKELDIQTYVSCNGQYVVVEGEVIYSNPLSKEALHLLTDLAVSNNHPIVYMDHEDMTANVPHHDHIIESIETLKINKFPIHDPHSFKERETYQAILFCKEKEEECYEQKVNQFDFIRWHKVAVDVFPTGGSKAQGIKKIIEKLKIAEERQFAFGDGLNDIDMFLAIRNSVAMGNAHSSAKKAAKFITKPVDQDGILHGLRMLGLLH